MIQNVFCQGCFNLAQRATFPDAEIWRDGLRHLLWRYRCTNPSCPKPMMADIEEKTL